MISRLSRFRSFFCSGTRVPYYAFYPVLKIETKSDAGSRYIVLR